MVSKYCSPFWGGGGLKLTLSIRIALVRAIPVMSILQLKRLIRDNFCVFRSGALTRTGIGSEMRNRSVMILHPRKTEIKTGETAGKQMAPGLGKICHNFLNGWHDTKMETTVPAHVINSNPTLSQVLNLTPRIPSYLRKKVLAMSVGLFYCPKIFNHDLRLSAEWATYSESNGEEMQH